MQRSWGRRDAMQHFPMLWFYVESVREPVLVLPICAGPLVAGRKDVCAVYSINHFRLYIELFLISLAYK